MRSVRDFLAGVGFFFQGVGWVARHGRWWLFGLIPAFIAFAIYVAGLVYLGTNASGLAETLTPFADTWAWRDAFRVMVQVMLFLGGLALAVITFTAVTLAIGEPFYEKLSAAVDEVPGEVDEPWWRTVPRSIRDSLVTLGWVMVFSVPLFFLGFVPVLGQTVVPVLGAAVSGFFLAAELTTLALERRGYARKQRFALLRGRKGLALGFGVAVFVLFLVPFVAVVAMPAAVAGAALLVRAELADDAPAPATPLP
ncbi:EI24 domain-containing protein [Nonomuraea roseoviolacea subsp. roseoviolacea]|uniref:CysZ protein n=1 Tax=Nonomuraea roseoviolacea subsp. carminata TaxID=160689 RepID=A0ABT1K6F7_9ACTN|nr:EI24 domain-containing protein [Nonomuraea roseoviolacea]MCP2349592.1 CysZ protein [Nonomuraea roseoviolacea subsp. carminata]